MQKDAHMCTYKRSLGAVCTVCSKGSWDYLRHAWLTHLPRSAKAL
jgi:hypothetical protein